MSRDHSGDLVARVRETERNVLRYLLAHPDAKDTVEGILEWWLPDAIRGVPKTEVTRALEDLLDKGWITTSSFGGTTVYGLERTRRGDILQWLEN
jgi:hypothetical protein